MINGKLGRADIYFDDFMKEFELEKLAAVRREIS
jgi:hypothetical protein